MFVALLLGNDATSQRVNRVEQWIKLPVAERPDFENLDFAKKPLSKVRAEKVKTLLWNDHLSVLREQRKQEWKAKVISIDDLEMKFDIRVYGTKPETGRRLFISMHGGGETRAQVNDQQWKNQIRLYQPKEGVYIAPRAPTNTWNMWHAEHIDEFFHRIILNSILFEGVDPNRVYLMGYSAGGDGVYQLAPRMADSLAAAAMMAGHPNGASPANLRNIGFALHMGAKDSAYKRNKVAEKWKNRLAELEEDDPKGYKHQVQIHEGLGHWMKRKDAVAVPWMSKFVRDPQPEKVVWRKVGFKRDNFYWLAIDSNSNPKAQKLVVTRKGQGFDVETADQIKDFRFHLNDSIVDLDKPIVVSVNGQVIQETTADRNAANIFRSIKAYSDPFRIYSASVAVTLSSRDEAGTVGSTNNGAPASARQIID
jgi:predicted esterase